MNVIHQNVNQMMNVKYLNVQIQIIRYVQQMEKCLKHLTIVVY